MCLTRGRGRGGRPIQVTPESQLGRRLLKLDVTTQELAATRVFKWSFQAGGAITLPLFRGRVVVLMKGRYLRRSGGELQVADSLVALLRHEF